jgi:hypothetical protein
LGGLKAFWPASLGGDVPDGEVALLAASSRRRMHCNGGASSTIAVVVFGFVSRSGVAEKGDQEEDEGWRRCGGRRGRETRVCRGDLRGGGVLRWWLKRWRRLTRSACLLQEADKEPEREGYRSGA